MPFQIPNSRSGCGPPQTHYIQPHNEYIWEFLRQNEIWVHECQYHEAEVNYQDKQLYYTMRFKPSVEKQYILHENDDDCISRPYH